MKFLHTCLLMLSIFLLFPGHGLCASPQHAQTTQLQQLFDEAEVTGTFVLYDVSGDRLVVHNKSRAETQFIPASTFKIPNSLIGLASGAVSSVDEILPYGGKPQYLKSWEQDMGLREAIKISNVPIYQELARRIGLDRMSEYISQLDYGNKTIGNTVDIFWLQGPLKISAMEQSKFLAQLAQQKLPISVEAQTKVRNILRVNQGENWVLYAKTGWTSTPTPDIGWWVGWVEKDEHIYSFALNIDMLEKADAAKRVELGEACLRLLGVVQ